MTWDLYQLRDDVERAFGQDQRDFLNPCAQSIAERFNYASYHHKQSTKLIAEAVTVKGDVDLFGWMLGATDDPSRNFNWVRFQAEAHVMACIQSLHCLADTFAHTVYFGLGLNLDPNSRLRERSIDAHNVCKSLPDGPIKKPFAALMDHPEFTYLGALVNRSKHRSIVRVQYSVDLRSESPDPPGLKFSAFDHDGKHYPERWVTPTLGAEFTRQGQLIQAAGCALNEAVAAMPIRTDPFQ